MPKLFGSSEMSEKTREILKKKARVRYLVDFLKQNGPFLVQRIEAGFFTSAADDLRAFAANCDEIARLNGEIVQMTLDLEPRTYQVPLAIAG